MYYDEDGDLADEFYEEITPKTGAPWMRKITEHLTWQVNENNVPALWLQGAAHKNYH